MSDQTSHNFAQFPTLTPTQRVYVFARARGKSNTEAAEQAGVSRRTPLNWDSDLINAAILELQQELFSDGAKAVAHIVPAAIAELEKAVTSGDIAAIREVFDRRWGKPIARNDVNFTGDVAHKVYFANDDFNPDDA
jgi:hypothetical protein